MRVDRRPYKRAQNADRRLLGARRLRRRRYNYPSIKQEPKFYDTFYPNTLLSITNDFTGSMCDPTSTSMISTPSVGDSEQNRDGKKIVITQVEIKGVVFNGIQANQTGVDDWNHCWVALVLDTQSNQVQMSASDCFKALSTNAFVNRPFRNLLFGNRFRILKMKQFTFRSGYWSGVSPSIIQEGQGKLFTMYKKLRLPVNFNAGTTSSIANVMDNSLHVVAWSSGATAAVTTMAYQARIRFVG